MTVKEIIQEKLKSIGADGLITNGCGGCDFNELHDCYYLLECEPAKLDEDGFYKKMEAEDG
jgi:hypothetical protein